MDGKYCSKIVLQILNLRLVKVGAAIKQIECFKRGVGMMGYGLHSHIVEGQKTPLKVRTFFIQNDLNTKRLIWVTPEILSASQAIKRGVLNLLHQSNPSLNIKDCELMISATHTHSGPGGYFDYAIYNMTISGFNLEIYDSIVKAIVDSIIDAYNALEKCEAHLYESSFNNSIKVAFNRSIEAYNQNPEIKSLDYNQRHLAVNRSMKLIEFSGKKKIGCINWFGVHTTSVGNDLMNICFDNKGYAAQALETWKSEIGSENYISAFAQEASGDVSPNYVWDSKRNRMRGGDVDDYKNAESNGNSQFELVKEILNNENKGYFLKDDLDSMLCYVDFTKVKVDPKFSNGLENCRTGPAAMGLAFFMGATDGMGIPQFLKPIIGGVIGIASFIEGIVSLFDVKTKARRKLKKSTHGKKKVFIETSEGRILCGDTRRYGLAIAIDETTKYMKRQLKSGGMHELPWTPDVLPVQIHVLGEVAILGVPAEITTIAGQRLRQTVLNILSLRGIKDVIISSYSNAYAGYITTNEEYSVQAYEGGHTLFGQWTLAAYQTIFEKMAKAMLLPEEERTIAEATEPFEFKPSTIESRTYGKF